MVMSGYFNLANSNRNKKFQRVTAEAAAAELTVPSRVACSDLVDLVVFI